MNCRCSRHVPSWRAQWWPVTTLSCENWSQLSIVIIWSPADQSVPALHSAFCCTTRLLGFLQTDRQRITGDSYNQMCLVRLIIMAVLVKFLPGKVVHVALKQTRHWTLYWIRVLRRCKNNPTSSCSAQTGLYDLKDFLFTEQPLLAFIHIHLPLLRSRNWQNYLENMRIIWKIRRVYCYKRCV